MRLRDVVEDDLEAFFEHQRDPAACAMAQFPPRSRDHFLHRWWSTLGDDAIRKQTIEDGKQIAGYVASWSDGRRLVAYWLGSAFWGRGLASAALAEFIARHETTRPLHAYVAVENARSRRVLEKCGFVRDGEETKGRDGVYEISMALR
jgi:RimJ/RimL family protein N-acetyltransferase